MRKAMWFSAMLSIGLLCGSCGIAAQSSSDPMGEWVMRAGQRTMFVLSIHPAKDAVQACAVSLSRPQHLQTADAVSFSHVSGPVVTEPIVGCEREAGALSITVENPKDSKDRDAYRFVVRTARMLIYRWRGCPCR